MNGASLSAIHCSYPDPTATSFTSHHRGKQNTVVLTWCLHDAVGELVLSSAKCTHEALSASWQKLARVMPGGVLGTKGSHQLQTMAMPPHLVGHHLGASAAPNTHSFILQEGNVLGCPTRQGCHSGMFAYTKQSEQFLSGNHQARAG